MKQSRIAIVIVALLALAVPATSSAKEPDLDRFQWFVSDTSFGYQLPNASTPYTLQNRNGGFLGYGKRNWGINLVWSKGGSWEFQRANVRDHRRLNRDETVAIYNSSAKAYLVYEKRSNGINLAWSSRPSREWKLERSSGMVSIYNTVARDHVVYGERSTGINLRWLSDLKPKAPTSTSTAGSATVWLKADPPVQGYIPFVGTYGQNSSGNITSIQNPSKDTALLFVKKGRSSTECGNPDAVVRLGPEQTMTPEQRQAAFGLPAGVTNPYLPATFVACVQTSNPSLSTVPINITYRLNG